MTAHPMWSHSLRERIRMLRSGTARIAYLSERAEPGTFRYRCINPVDAINRSSEEMSASYFFLRDYETIDDLSEFADVLVLSRVPYDVQVDSAIRQFQQKGRRVFFDIDDLVIDQGWASLVASSLNYRLVGKELNSWTAFSANISLAMSRTDGVITSTDYLAKRIREAFPDLPVVVVPNTLNQAQLEVSESAFTRRNATGPGLSIGYFSGSPSHAKDFAIARDAIVDFLSHSPESTLTVVGHLDLPKQFRGLEAQVRRLPFMDFLELQEALAAVDLSLAPLHASAFTHSKSELKYFEAAAVGTITLASASPAFDHAIDHGKTGFLADDSQWSDRLRAINALSDSEKRQISLAARSDAINRYGPSSLVSALSKLFIGTN